MARDYENTDDLEGLDDVELRELVRERLADSGSLDVDNVTVRVHEGMVHLSGRVGTEEEARVAEHVLTDGLGLKRYENELVVDPLRRSENPEGADDERGDGDPNYLLGDRPRPLSPEAAHLEEDLEARLYGTHDLQDAIESGESYNPPDRPTPEGRDSAG